MTKTFQEWSQELGIPLHIVRDRFNRGVKGESYSEKLK